LNQAWLFLELTCQKNHSSQWATNVSAAASRVQVTPVSWRPRLLNAWTGNPPTLQKYRRVDGYAAHAFNATKICQGDHGESNAT
jgi:hypothetical protein